MLAADGDGGRRRACSDNVVDGRGRTAWIIGTWRGSRGRGRADYRNMAKLRRPRPPPGLSEHVFSYFMFDFSSLMCIMIVIVEAETTFKETEE